MGKYELRFKEQLHNIQQSLKSNFTKVGDNHLVSCDICNHIREVSPASINRSIQTKCPECLRIKRLNDFLKVLHSDSDYYLVDESEFENTVIKVEVKCLKCSESKKVIPNSILSGQQRRCGNCIQNERKKDFLELIKNSGFTLLSEFTSMRNKHKMVCESGHINLKNSSDLRSGRGCNDCYYEELREESLNSFLDLLKKEGYYLISYYSNTKEKTLLKNLNCNHQPFYMKPADFIYNQQRCPQCNVGGKRTHEEFIKLVKNTVGYEYQVITKYTRAEDYILMKHIKCGKAYQVTPSAFLNNGNRCPHCNSSRGERAISLYLDNNNINYLSQYTFDDLKYERLLRLDFYLPDFNLILEYDGEGHFFPVDFAGRGEEWAQKEFEGVQLRDQIKNEYTKDNNINMLRIPYWDIDKVDFLIEQKLHSIKEGSGYNAIA